MAPSDPLSNLAGTAALAAYLASQAGLLFYAAHRWRMLGGIAPLAPCPAPWWEPGEAPLVLVQLPVRDEPAVVERLVAAVAALDWPLDRLQVQLLDDSGEACAALGERALARARAAGVNAVQLRRAERTGFKAGALADGLARSDAAFVAVLDADFVPAPDFLRRTLPRFADPRLGLVQARWAHLDRDANLLTRAQAVLLDAHQLAEHAWRQAAGLFLNFNGTAGVWRRACIEDSGGWQHDTLTEDLDLSYRAQLRGWRFVFDAAVVVPGELPGTMAAFRTQQHRWTKGALQTARKLLPAVWRSTWPFAVKAEALQHLTANVTYPLLLILTASLGPLLLWSGPIPRGAALALHSLVFVGGTSPVALFLGRGQHLAGRRGPRMWADVGLALLLCAGMALHLAHAVAEGLWGATGTFVRTPKTGRTGRVPSRFVVPRAGEALLALACLALALTQVAAGHATGAPFLLAMSAGCAWVALRRAPVATAPRA